MSPGQWMEKTKAVLFFLLWLSPALIAAAIYIAVADRVCQVEPSKQHGEQQEGTTGYHANIGGYGDDGRAAPLLTAFHVAQTDPNEPQGNTKPPERHPKAERWATKFFCEAKALDVALVLFTYCLVIVTGWLVYATVGLREETATLAQFARQQAEDMKASIAAADKSAIAGMISAETARASARAIVALKNFTGRMAPDKIVQGYATTPNFENVGGSYVLNCSLEGQIKVVPSGTLYTFEPKGKGETTTGIPPGGKMSAAGYLGISLADAMNVWNGTSDCFVWFLAKYEDVFGVRHHTECCVKIGFAGDPSIMDLNPGNEFITYRPYGPQNAAS